ncbi:MAG: hypothetical protein WC426_05940 [Sulfuriferula sp.]
MPVNPGYIGTGAYKTGAACLMQDRKTSTQSTTQSGGASFAQTLSNVTSTDAVQNRQQAKASVQSIAQSQQAGADIMQLSQSLQGNTYATAADYLQTLSQLASQSLTTDSVSTQA